MNDSIKHYPGLDLAKFCSSIIILLHHYYLNTGIPELKVFAYGGILVELFFMISGVLGGIRRERISILPYKEYMIRVMRAFFPMTILSVLVYAALGIWHYLAFGWWYREAAVDFWALLNSILLLFAGGAIGNINRGINNPIWFLCVLLICHTFLFGIQRVAKRCSMSPVYGYLGMICVGVAAATYGINLPFCNAMVARGYYSFFGGCVIAFLIKKRKRSLFAIAILTIVTYLFPMLIGWSFMYTNWNYSIPFILFPAVVIIGTYPINSKVICRLFRFLSGWSLEIYLWHGSLLLLQGILYSSGKVQYGVKTLAVFLASTAVVTLLMYVLVENKINQLILKRAFRMS